VRRRVAEVLGCDIREIWRLKKLADRVAEELERANLSPTLRFKIAAARALGSQRMVWKMCHDPELQAIWQQIVLRLVAQANPGIANCESYMRAHPGSYVDDYGVIRHADGVQGAD
jgi:hypothetical protein